MLCLSLGLEAAAASKDWDGVGSALKFGVAPPRIWLFDRVLMLGLQLTITGSNTRERMKGSFRDRMVEWWVGFFQSAFWLRNANELLYQKTCEVNPLEGPRATLKNLLTCPKMAGK